MLTHRLTPTFAIWQRASSGSCRLIVAFTDSGTCGLSTVYTSSWQTAPSPCCEKGRSAIASCIFFHSPCFCCTLDVVAAASSWQLSALPRPPPFVPHGLPSVGSVQQWYPSQPRP